MKKILKASKENIKKHHFHLMLVVLGITIASMSVYFYQHTPALAATMAERLKGKILLQVERNGEAWYVYPKSLTRFFLGRPMDAFNIMRFKGLGITNADLAKIPRAGTNDVGDANLSQRLSGYILLQVERNGEAWYVYPGDLHRYYLDRPADAFRIMRERGLGITNNNLNQITVDSGSMNDVIDQPGDSGWVWDETPPVLSNAMVNFGPYNSSTSKAGDFYFQPIRDRVFGEFGRTVTDGEGNPKVLPTYDYFLSASTNLVSPLTAKVVRVMYQADTSDYEVHLRSSENNVWLISFDHITNLNPAIVLDATISVGQFVGNPAPWGGSYLVELMITRDTGSGAQAYCPYDFFNSSLKSSFTTNLNRLMSDWEAYKGDSSIYNEAGFYKPGCLAQKAAA